MKKIYPSPVSNYRRASGTSIFGSFSMKTFLLFSVFLSFILSFNAHAQVGLTYSGVDNNLTAQYADLGTVSSFTNFTVEFNVKNIGANAQNYDRFVSGFNNAFEIACNAAGQVEFYSGVLGIGWLNTGYTMPAGTWQHMSFVRNGTTISMYVNGVFTWSNGCGGGAMPSQQWILGANQANFIENANVTMDNFRLWNTDMTAGQIATNYTLCLTGSEANLVRLYNFEENTGTVLNDLATGDGIQNANLVNGPTWGPGFACQASPAAALNFDGTASWVNCGNILTGSYTKEAWVNINFSGTNNNIISGGIGGQHAFWAPFGYGYQLSAGHNGAWNQVQDPTPLVAGTWYHVAVTYDATSSTMNLYKNGVLVSTNNSVAAYVGGIDVLLGAYGAGSNLFNGSMDEVRIWNRPLCQSEIQNSMNCEIPTTGNGLIANYHFNEGLASAPNPTVTTLNDASGNLNNGTLTSFALIGAISNWVAPGGVTTGVSCGAFTGPTITVNSGVICSGNSFTMTPSGASTYTFSGGSAVVSPTANASYSVTGTDAGGCVSSIPAVSNVTVTVCSPGAALNFDGVDDQINLGTAMNSSLGTFTGITVEAWVNPANFTANGEIIGNYSSPNNQLQFLLRRDANFYSFWVDPGTGYQGSNTPAGTATLNVWQHVAGVWDGTQLKIYINGSLQATQPGVTGAHLNSSVTNSVVLGYETAGAGEGFTGNMDEVRIWSRVLCQGEIQNSMNCEIPTTASGLFANYHFNQGIASAPNFAVTTLNDVSGNAYNGTLSNFALSGPTSNWVAPGAVTTGVSCGAFTGPTITVNSGTICSGNSFTMSPSGASTYTYSGGSAVVSPTTNASYSVTGTDAGGCIATNTAVSSVTVNTTPTISVNSGAICSGKSFTMVPSGASTYTYSGGSAVVSPTANATYSVTGTSAMGCLGGNTAISSVSVNASPTVSAVTSSSLICSQPTQQTATLTASGASTYTWNPGGAGTSIAVSPSVTTTYTVTGTNGSGCMNSIVITQSVSTCTGINQISISGNDVKVYPNPFNGKINISSGTVISSVQVFNALGSLVYNAIVNDVKTEIDLTAQASGIYFVKIGSSTIKIIKE